MYERIKDAIRALLGRQTEGELRAQKALTEQHYLVQELSAEVERVGIVRSRDHQAFKDTEEVLRKELAGVHADLKERRAKVKDLKRIIATMKENEQ